MADNTPNSLLKKILNETKTIAMVGVSSNRLRPSYFVARYLHYRGYNVLPINPGQAGKTLFGRTVYASLADIPKDVKVDMVDVFRRPEAVPGILDEALEHLPDVKTLWLQFGIYSPEAETKARSLGMNIVQDRCPKIEFQKLCGELRKAGFNTGIISSKLPEWT